MDEVKINYEVVSEIAGHQSNNQVLLTEACEDIFSKVKEKSMQLAIGGAFVQFANHDELRGELTRASTEGLSIRCYDEVIGG